MTTDAPNTKVAHRPRWRQVATAVFLWLFGCSLIGLFVAAINGEHGSILFAMFGIAIDCGALSHSVFLTLPWFHASRPAVQALAVWAGTAVLLFVFAAFSASQSEGPYVGALAESLSAVLLFCLPSAFVAAFAFVTMVKNAA